MKTADLIIAVNTVWVVLQDGGTHGSPVSPLLHTSNRRARSWAALGQSPAPPAVIPSLADDEGAIS
jgi:hypothetical protein